MHTESTDTTNGAAADLPADLFAYALAGTEGIPSYADLMDKLRQPSYRAQQLAQWLWVRAAARYDDMTNLPADVRTQLAQMAVFQRAVIADVQHSRDGTRKYLLRFADGICAETVALPQRGYETSDGSARLTVCVSAQAGCTLACSFCATGRSGFSRNLLPGEIAEQVRVVAADYGHRVSNVVVMGQGEPFLNYDATLAGLRIINAANAAGGLGIGARHITLSTAGIISGIKRLAAEPQQFTLAVSLHSAVQATRDRLMPGLQGQPLAELNAALQAYYQQTKRRPSLEYALIAGVNDSTAEIAALAQFARSCSSGGAHVNLIPLNASATDDALLDLQPTNAATAARIAETLRSSKVEVSIRASRGSDIAAACGQLAQQHTG
ncbi:MAG: 23S rRNA (adenine(2503)-C(2))-methyltransferase RlmN [Coriobacteriia bacterium]|nr:23S rRNA (adenine(2503)-C(2))-methyltransferase RlmN [Coriobacteriia bacterium]